MTEGSMQGLAVGFACLLGWVGASFSVHGLVLAGLESLVSSFWFLNGILLDGPSGFFFQYDV
jgi:hypothetical protein